jgi:REP element-mobilizing transposase RayT
MNRGHNGIDIFCGDKNKNQFLEYLNSAAIKLKIKVFAYCVMDNHYHLIIENSSGKMSEFLKQLNGLYGMYYRKFQGGRGYVFQSRFKSTLIEKDAYLIQSIVYLLRNPVRAGIVQKSEDYKWSSINAYYSNVNDTIVDAEFVDELFGTKESLMTAIHSEGGEELPVRISKYGEFLGSDAFFKSAFKKYDRRKRPSDQSMGTQRQDDYYFDPVEKVIWEFEKKKGVRVDDIDTSTYEGKRNRGELLVLLKDKAGLTYKEISFLDIFGDLNFNSLRGIYRNVKKRLST